MSEMEYECPSCKQTLALDSFGEFECPHCNYEFNYGFNEFKYGGLLWKDQSPFNKKIAIIITNVVGLIGAVILLLAAIAPGPLKGLGVIILIAYVVIMPRILEEKQIIGSDWRNARDGGGGSGGGG